MTKEERDLLLIVATVLVSNHTGSGPDANRQREALRKALAPFKAAKEYDTMLATGIIPAALQHRFAKEPQR